VSRTRRCACVLPPRRTRGGVAMFHSSAATSASASCGFPPFSTPRRVVTSSSSRFAFDTTRGSVHGRHRHHSGSSSQRDAPRNVRRSVRTRAKHDVDSRTETKDEFAPTPENSPAGPLPGEEEQDVVLITTERADGSFARIVYSTTGTSRDFPKYRHCLQPLRDYTLVIKRKLLHISQVQSTRLFAHGINRPIQYTHTQTSRLTLFVLQPQRRLIATTWNAFATAWGGRAGRFTKSKPRLRTRSASRVCF